MNEAEAALGVRQSAPGAVRQFSTHPAIDPSPQRRHGLGAWHSVADDQPGAGLFGALPKGRQISGVMLAIAIQRHGPGKAQL